MGLSGLSQADQEKVAIGNILMLFSASLIRECGQAQIPCSLENPARSRLWICSAMRRLSRTRGFSIITTEFCQWGVPWKKSTSFLSSNLDLIELANTRCVGSKRGICSRTGRGHQQLQGKDPSGNFYTKLAEPYPKRLCKALAKAYYNSWAKGIGDSFGRFMQ